jgi:hypothetical protein
MPKKEMALRVSHFCAACMARQAKRFCPSQDCELYPIRIMRTVVPDQSHLFKVGLFVDFAREVLRMAETMPSPFWFSDLRGKVNVQPLNPNWYGTVCRTKSWKQAYVRTGETRVSDTISARGRTEFQYARRYAAAQ